MPIPYVFIFDIDQCILGNVHHLVEEYHLYTELKELYGEPKIPYVNTFKDDMKNGLLRPGFKDFIDCIKKRFKPCEIFVYTNSSYAWTNNCLVSTIEKAANVKFNKPYFNRDNSILLYKSIEEAYQIIFPLLNKKYNNKLLKHKDDIIKNRLVFVDNIKDNTSTYVNRQITCPVYDVYPYRCPYENMLVVFGSDIMWKKETEERIFSKDTYLEYYNPNSKDLTLYHLYKLIKMRDSELHNNKYKDDDFYLTLCNKLTDLSDKTLANIK
tara:strand:- start:250 stop:1053 length:804 start_codon:yes stop_codon:yes gene_type:complete